MEEWIDELAVESEDGGKEAEYDKIGRSEAGATGGEPPANKGGVVSALTDKIARINNNLGICNYLHRDNLWEVPFLASFMFCMYFMHVYNSVSAS